MVRKDMVAVDIGAGSGRVFLGRYDGNALDIRELYRFTHDSAQIGGDIYRDLLLIWNEVSRGLGMAAQSADGVASIGVDSFTPDFCVMDPSGYMISNMLSYRTMIGGNTLNELLQKHPARELFERSGTQPGEILMLPQLMRYVATGREWALRRGKTLPLASAVNYWLTGEMTFDFTSASITMFWDRAHGRHDNAMLGELIGFDDFLPPMAPNLSMIGRTRKLAALPGMENVPVMNVGVHDTADALFYLGQRANGEICVNCGTWAAVGVICDQPIVNDEAFEAGLTNYGLPDGRYMLGCVFPAMMHLQDCMRLWKAQGLSVSNAELSRQAERVTMPPMDLDDPVFLDHTMNELEKIRSFCVKRNMEIPQSEAQYTRCIYESVVLKLWSTIKKLEKATGRAFREIHLGGGAILSKCFVELCASRTGMQTIPAVTEATVAGNFVAQLMAAGELKQGETPKVVTA